MSSCYSYITVVIAVGVVWCSSWPTGVDSAGGNVDCSGNSRSLPILLGLDCISVFRNSSIACRGGYLVLWNRMSCLTT